MQSDSTPNSPDELMKRFSERQSELEQVGNYTRRQKQLIDSLLDSDDDELFNERFHKRLLIEVVGFMHEYHMRSTARRLREGDMELLRRGVNRHRLACGVLRIGGPPALGDVLSDCHWAEWVKLARKPLAHWPQLLELELLDAVALEEAQSFEDRAGNAELVLVEVKRSLSRPTLLACRRDPLVMEIAASLCDWMEVS